MSETQPRIRLLPESLINQIAAGEVVERPAAVLKELLENCLDAGARRVEIECEQAGMRLIRVRDDGHGIPAEDLALALCRHATSKISRLDDLDRIASMGFRGEALPSIGAVSRLTIVSRTSGADSAWQAALEGRADVSGPVPASHPVGTTVEVRELFFNTPARRRFLRSERTELLHIQQTVRNLALSRPDVGIRLLHNRQTLLQLPPAVEDNAAQARLARLFGTAFEQSALPVNAEAGGLQACGWISPVAQARNQSDLQALFVNGRPIRDQGLQHAIRLAYEDSLPDGRFPAYVIHLAAPSEHVDINVHPAKSEVRFRQPRQVHDFLLSALRQALRHGADGTPAMVPAAAWQPAIDERMPSASPVDRRGGPHVAETRPAYRDAPIAGGGATPAAKSERVLDVFGGRYAIVRSDDTLTIIDLAKAYAALNQARFLDAETSPGVRPLLFPVSTKLPAVDAKRRARDLRALAELGFDLQCESPDAVQLCGVPATLPEADPAVLLNAIATALSNANEEAATGTWIARLAEAIPLPKDSQAQKLLDEIRRRVVDTRACQRSFSGDELGRLLNFIP